MQEASFNGILKTIFYFVAFYDVFKFLARLFLPMLVKKVVEKAGENFQQQSQYQSGSFNQSDNLNKEPIISDTAKSAKPHETKKVGEYVDYEEIE